MQYDFSDVSSESESDKLGKLYPITLCEYNPEYKKLFESERDFLQGVFGESALRISHIGSTAVPRLISKPTIDILLEIKQNCDLAKITEYLTRNGYIVNSPPLDKIMYIKGYGPAGYVGQTYHIHVREAGDYDELYFRDYLILHSDAAEEYGKLKLKLKVQFERDRDGYTAAKSEFVFKHTKSARAELGDKYDTKISMEYQS